MGDLEAAVKALKIVLFSLIGLLLTALMVLYLFLRASLPETRGTLFVTGLRHPVTVERHRWGVPFLTATDQNDFFFAIGFLHAQDRLFQMDLSRRAATGRLAEIFGPLALARDGERRDELPDETIARNRRILPPGLRSQLESYCGGVNAFITGHPLPPEFHLLDYTPQKWGVDDVLAVFMNIQNLLAESGEELYNARVFHALPADKAQALLFGNLGLTIADSAEAVLAARRPELNGRVADEQARRDERIGSNNWVVAGWRTASGQPLLANDPHLGNVFPSYFYQISARCSGRELCGQTIPGVPFVIIGRNSDIGWGFTNTGTDVIDYYELRTRPANPDQYMYNGQWETFARRRSQIAVRGGKPQTHTVRVSRFGPVITREGRAMAMHSINLYPSRTPEALAGMNQARNLDEFVRALRLFTGPAQNVVFADRRGAVGYYPAGWIPVRSKGNGALPVRVEGSADIWQGFIDEAQKPLLIDPPSGFVVTANNPVLPEGKLPIFSLSWTPSFRADRIRELLRSSPRLGLEEMKSIQCDSYLKNAEFLLQRIRNVQLRSAKAAAMHRLLNDWNGRADSGPEPFIFYRFERHLAEILFAPHLAEHTERGLISTAWLYRILRYPDLQPPDQRSLSAWADDPATPRHESFDQIVERALVDAFNDYRDASRLDPESVRWETAHTLSYRHPLGRKFLLNPFLNRGPFPMAGGRNCIMTAAFDDQFQVTHLSSFRMILDFSSSFANSLLINSSGQSGHFMSPYYGDQIPLFTAARYRPMEDRSPTPQVLVLTPDGR
jgi:penicillin G amidase